MLDPRQDLWQDMFYPGSEEENLLAWSFFMLEQQHRLHELPPLALKRRLLTETLTMETGSLDGVNTVEDRIPDLICAYGDRAELLHVTPGTVSHHMSSLVGAGFVSVSKSGSRINYTLQRKKLADFIDLLRASLLE